MELLLSNLPPIRSSNSSFCDAFEKLLQETDKVCIATGYISAESLTELKGIAEANQKQVELLIGMHFFEGITKVQYQAAKYLNDFLIDNNLGKVYIANVFKYHGKLYTFHKGQNPYAGIIGSSNLNSILKHHRNYETDILLKEANTVLSINNFIKNLINETSMNLNDWSPESFNEINPILEGHENVEHCSQNIINDVLNRTTQVVFEIPLKATSRQQKSNLNAYFGKGRKNKGGLIKPRHWYEVEIIVPKYITDSPEYPKAGYPKKESIITVFTDDGWKFDCKISGDYSKNFRSCYDLKILGKWIKGRLENNGALKVGEPVTEQTLENYGRNDIKLIGTNNPKEWYLDFCPGGVI